MAARSIASLTLSFGLVSIPVRLYSATESTQAVHFNLLAPDGSRLKQQYVSEKTQEVVPRADIVKGYEFEKDRFVLFTPDELKTLEEGSSPSVEIVAFIPQKTVDPIYYDKAYLLAPDKRGAKPYSLLMAAMRESGRCALAKWAWKTKQYIVQIRPAEGGLVLQQLMYAEEVRPLSELEIETVDVSAAELKLALQLIAQISEDAYEPKKFVDEEKKRVLAAIDEKIAGKQIVASAHEEAAKGGQVIDLMEALRSSLGKKPASSSGGDDAGNAKSTSSRKTSGKAVATPADSDKATVKATTGRKSANVADLAEAKRRKGVKGSGSDETGRPTKAEPASAPPTARAARGGK